MSALRTAQATRQSGFTYVGLLIFVAVLSLMSSSALRVGMTMQRHQDEQDLLDRGQTLVKALASYMRATPAGQSRYPKNIEDLLRDPRYPKNVVRHLRTIAVDPMTGKAEWGLLLTTDKKGITGFYSLSDAKPWRKSFMPPFDEFEDKPRYKDWLFTIDLLDE
jgi:type II secretory pathway pseudopilin PulG